MSLRFTDIEPQFTARGLQLPELNVLKPDAQPYEVIAIQPGGTISATDDFVRQNDRASALKKFSQFLGFAVEKNAGLVLSPEYSCPWDALATAVRDRKLPAIGKLWALGCESITPNELRRVTAELPNIEWIHEPIPAASGGFLGAICFLLKTRSTSGEVKDVALLQFKTVAMGGSDTFERDRLIRGSFVYCLRNADDFIHFTTMLCSEVLEFVLDDDAGVRLSQHPSVIFHPQLILEPRHADIRKYRSDLYAHTCSRSVDVIVLNWARRFRLGATESSNGGSAIFTKADKFNRGDDRIHQNHQRGMYYSRWDERHTDLCIFNFDEHIFHFQTQKVALIGPVVEARRTGPEMLAIWEWNSDEQRWTETPNASDGFERLCGTYGVNGFDWCLESPFTCVDRERLLTLSAGTLDPDVHWHRVENVPSFIVGADERSKRLTFVHEQSSASREFRNKHLSRFITLQTRILRDTATFPPTIQDLRGDWQLRPPKAEDDFRFNLVSKSRNAASATGIFLGAQSRVEVQNLKQQLVKAWGGIKESPTHREEKTRRLVIWYENASGKIECESQPLPTIVDDSEPPASYARNA